MSYRNSAGNGGGLICSPPPAKWALFLGTVTAASIILGGVKLALSETQTSSSGLALKNQIEAGLSKHLLALKAQSQDTYPIWPKSSKNQFFVFTSPNLFNSGIFYADLSMVASVTGTNFEVGQQPHLVAVLAEHINSWQDVNKFLSHQNTSFRIPENAMTDSFSGCNTIRFSHQGIMELAIIVIDTTESKKFSQIDNCMLRAMMDVFGFDTQGSSDRFITDLIILRTIYRLDDKERNSSRVVDEIIRRLPENK